MGGEFTSIPFLDYTLIASGRKEEFVAQLRNAVVNVGFMYLAHPPVDRAVVSRLLELTPKLFDIPQAKKDALRMANSPHFLGYSKLGVELTKGATDQREQFDFATQFDADAWSPGEPDFLRLQGESQVRVLCKYRTPAITVLISCFSTVARRGKSPRLPRNHGSLPRTS